MSSLGEGGGEGVDDMEARPLIGMWSWGQCSCRKRRVREAEVEDELEEGSRLWSGEKERSYGEEKWAMLGGDRYARRYSLDRHRFICEVVR